MNKTDKSSTILIMVAFLVFGLLAGLLMNPSQAKVHNEAQLLLPGGFAVIDTKSQPLFGTQINPFSGESLINSKYVNYWSHKESNYQTELTNELELAYRQNGWHIDTVDYAPNGGWIQASKANLVSYGILTGDITEGKNITRLNVQVKSPLSRNVFQILLVEIGILIVCAGAFLIFNRTRKP